MSHMCHCLPQDAPGESQEWKSSPLGGGLGKYFSGSMDFGSMMEAATVLSALQAAFTTLVTQMGSLDRLQLRCLVTQCCFNGVPTQGRRWLANRS